MLADAHDLVRLGLTDAGGILDRTLIVRPAGGRSGRNLTVAHRRGASFFVKVSDPQTADHERRVIGWLTDTPAAGHAPRVATASSSRERIVLDLLDGGDAARHHGLVAGFAPALGHAVGTALGAVHAVCVPAQFGGDATRRPQVLGVGALPFELYCALSAANLECVAVLQEHGAIDAPLAALADGWRSDVLMHGDIRLANLMLENPDSATPHVRIVDWEFAGMGDAAWDVGCLLAAYLGLWISSLPDLTGLGNAEMLDRAGRPLDTLRPGLRAMWRGYRTARGFDAETAVIERDRAMRFAGAALVEHAFVLGQGAPRMTRHQVVSLQLAVDLLARPDEVARRLLHLPAADE